jgi:tetratricopeptide (TPR) repeat protein
MPKTDPLFELIHALSRSEKRYFRLFCTRDASGENYLRLFDTIDGQSEYDEATIKRMFRHLKFTKQLHVTKNYLRRLILKTLRNYHANLSKDAELKDILRNVEILFNKELYTLCQSELKRGDAIASRHELLSGTIDIESWKRKLFQTLQPHGYAVFRETLDAQKSAISRLRSTNDSWQLAVNVSSGMFTLQSNISVRNVHLKDPGASQTLEARVLYYNTQYLLDLRNNDNSAAESSLTALITLLEAHPDRIKEEPGLYVSSINNLLSFFVFQKRYDEALSLIQKTKSIYNSWKITAANRTLLKQILRTYNVELEIYRASKSCDAQSDFVDTTESFGQANGQKIPKEYLVSFWFQLASIHFMRGNYSRALEWINTLLNARFKGVRTDLRVHAHILNLMIHLEQQNLMVLRYYVDSARRYLKKVRFTHAYTGILLKFFTRMGRLPVMEYKQAYRDLKEILYPQNGEALIPENIKDYIDFREWIETKI